MSRLSLLLPLLIYLTFEPEYARYPVELSQVLGFLAALLAVPLVARWVFLRLLTSGHPGRLHQTAIRIHRLAGTARMAVLLWTAPAMYLFGLAEWLSPLLVLPNPSVLGGVLVTLPAYLGWLAVYWAQFPAERALREQAMLSHLEEALPVHGPPRLHEFIGHQCRTGLGVFVVPVLCVLALRDAMLLGLQQMNLTPGVYAQSLLFIMASVVVFLLFPVLMVRLLRARALPPGPLRDRLESLARRSGVRIRDILLWDTGYTTCNAMVTGMVAPVRYVLLSDLLVEALRDEDIEAVFAHELGHIVHRHITWYATFLVSAALLLNWADLVIQGMARATRVSMPVELAAGGVSLAAILLGFGYLSRRFENQADVYAARAVGTEVLPIDPQPDAASGHPLQLPVTLQGAAVFVHALSRVAWINNIPISGRNFTHGSIASRLAKLSLVATTPEATVRFDRGMSRIRYLILILLIVGLATLIHAVSQAGDLRLPVW